MVMAAGFRRHNLKQNRKAGDTPYLVMEHIPGDTLAEVEVRWRHLEAVEAGAGSHLPVRIIPAVPGHLVAAGAAVAQVSPGRHHHPPGHVVAHKPPAWRKG